MRTGGTTGVGAGVAAGVGATTGAGAATGAVVGAATGAGVAGAAVTVVTWAGVLVQHCSLGDWQPANKKMVNTATTPGTKRL